MLIVDAQVHVSGSDLSRLPCSYRQGLTCLSALGDKT